MKPLGRRFAAIFAAALMFAAGCATSASAPPLPENYYGAYAQVQQWVPLGTSYRDAQRIMESHGFKCSLTRNAQWGDQNNVDYLYCEQFWSAVDSQLVVKRRWQVALFLADNKVSSIYLATGLIGR